MSRMIALLSVVIVLFAIAAGGSWYLQNLQTKDSDEKSGAEEKSNKKGASPLSTKQGGSNDNSIKGPIIRSAATPPESDRLTHLAATLQQQQDAMKAREQQITVREKQMDIVHEEVKKEHKKLELVRKEIQAELLLLDSKLVELEKRSVEGDKYQKAAAAQKKELETAILEVENQEWKNLKDQVKKLEAMEPEPAALVLAQMVDQGNSDTAVKMLFHMRHVQAAAVLAEIARQDPRLPAQLLERMLKLKGPTPPMPK